MNREKLSEGQHVVRVQALEAALGLELGAPNSGGYYHRIPTKASQQNPSIILTYLECGDMYP